MNNLKPRARSYFQNFWDIYTSRGPDNLEEALSMVDDNFNGFGTNVAEFWTCKNDLKRQLEKEIEQLPNGYQIRLHFTYTIENIKIISYVTFQNVRAITVFTRFFA